MKDNIKTFFCGSVISLAGAGLFGLINYFIRRTLCNTLSLADYGIFYSMFAFLSMVFGFTDLGLLQSGTYMIASTADDKKSTSTVFSQLFFIKALLAMLCAGGILIYFKLRGSGFDGLLLGIFLGMFICQVLNGTQQSLWSGLKKYSVQQFFYVFTAGFSLSLLLFFRPVTPLGVCKCFLTAVFTSLAGGLIYSRFSGLCRLRFEFDAGVCKKLLTTGGLVAITSTLLSVMYYMDTIMIDFLHGSESAGLYNIALPIMQIVQALMVFPSVFLPIAVDMGKKGENRQLLSFVRYALLVAVVLLLPVWGVFNWSGKFLISLLFNAQYIAAAPAVTILCVGIVFFTLGNFYFQIMLSLKKVVVMTFISGLSAAANLLLNYFLIKRMGICGAAWATMVSYIIFSVCTYIMLELKLRKG